MQVAWRNPPWSQCSTQSVEASLLRVDGTLASLSLDDLQKQGVGALPDRFTSLTVNDPRISYHALLKLAPVALTGGIAEVIHDLVDIHSPQSDKIMLVMDNLNTHSGVTVHRF